MTAQHLRTWWKSLSPRDRRLFAIWLAGMALGGLVWGASALMAAQARAQALLSAERQTLATMQLQAEEMLRLKQLPAAGGNVLRVAPGAVVDSLTPFGLSPEIIQPLAADGQLNLQGLVPFDKWLEWSAFVQKDMRLVVQKARVTRADLPGMVEIQATLAPGTEAP